MMTGANFRSFVFAGLLAAGSLLVGNNAASATPAASTIAGSGVSGMVREASQITRVRRGGRGGYRGGGRGYRGGWRGYRGGWGRYRGWYGGGPYFRFGAPYWYGGYYPYGYNNFYYRPPVRRAYRGGGVCGRAHRACVRNWGFPGPNYRGCMRYERCPPR